MGADDGKVLADLAIGAGVDACREKREQPLAAMSVETVIASNGLCRMITSAVPKPTNPLCPLASAATAAASATPPSNE